MSDMRCTYDGNREETIVAWLYDDLSPDERRAFDAHVAACAACCEELGALGAVRGTLQAWSPPAVAGRLAAPAPVGSRATAWRSAVRDIPAWAQVAAAALVIGIAAGIANLQVTVRQDGVSVRTGWANGAEDVEPARPMVPPAIVPVSHDELAALETELRRQIDAISRLNQQAPASLDAGQSQALLQQVRGLIAESEKKQQTELAVRLLTFDHDVQARRREDLRSIGLSLVKFREDSEAEAQRNRFDISTLAMRVSQPR